METVRYFIEIAAKCLGWESLNGKKAIIWEGSLENEVGRRADTNEVIIRVDKKYFRPTEVEELLGNPTKAYKKLGWRPKHNLESLIKEMIEADKKEAQKEYLIKKEGFKISNLDY